MIFKKQSLALLLACISSTAAFAPTAFNRAIATAPSALARTSTSVPKRFVTLNADVDGGSTDAVIEPDTEAEDVVESESAEVELVAEEAEAEAEAETVAEPVVEKKKERPEEDITRVAYVVNLSYGKSPSMEISVPCSIKISCWILFISEMRVLALYARLHLFNQSLLSFVLLMYNFYSHN